MSVPWCRAALAALFLWVVPGVALGAPVELPGESYSPAGLYTPEIVELDNGMRVILRPRHHTPGVSIRLVVGLGSAHYPCGRQELPHVLEHMVFNAIPGLTETELEEQIQALGGFVNAYVGRKRTVYELDIYSANTPVALELLSGMLFDGEFTQESLELSQSVVAHEAGGDGGILYLLAGLAGVDMMAEDYLDLARSPRYFRLCYEPDLGQDIGLEEIRQAYANYYRPDNTTLVMVGDFDLAQAQDWLQKFLAPVPPRDGPEGWRLHMNSDLGGQTYYGYTEYPGVGVVVLTEGLIAEDYYARQFLRTYLDQRLFRRLRIETGLTYTPDVRDRIYSAEYGDFVIYAETDTGSKNEALEIILEELAQLRREPIDEAVFRGMQHGKLMNWAGNTETNIGFAEHYVSSLFELDHYGHFVNDPTAIASLNPAQVHQVAREIFAPERLIIVRDADGWNRLFRVIAYWSLGAAILLAGLAIIVIGRLRRRRERHTRLADP